MNDFTKYCGIYFAHTIDDADWSYTVIFGYHIIEAGLNEIQAKTVSGHINIWLKDNEELVKQRRTEQRKLYDEYIQSIVNR